MAAIHVERGTYVQPLFRTFSLWLSIRNGTVYSEFPACGRIKHIVRGLFLQRNSYRRIFVSKKARRAPKNGQKRNRPRLELPNDVVTPRRQKPLANAHRIPHVLVNTDEPANDALDETRDALPRGGPERAAGPQRHVRYPRAMVSMSKPIHRTTIRLWCRSAKP